MALLAAFSLDMFIGEAKLAVNLTHANLVANARAKLLRKRADLIVANDVTAPGAGFEHDTNRVVILYADGAEREVPLADKRAVARAVLDAVIERRTKQ